jgi:hypothetical protein
MRVARADEVRELPCDRAERAAVGILDARAAERDRRRERGDGVSGASSASSPAPKYSTAGRSPRRASRFRAASPGGARPS